jgi:hypothetical protein
MGAGSLFWTDDEAGEMFSSSYLSDLKEGRLSTTGVDDSGRLSELSRRNSMVPLHLKSSYPVNFHNKISYQPKLDLQKHDFG